MINDIKSLSNSNFNSTELTYDITTPSFLSRDTSTLKSYTVERHEEMRIDLVMNSMYGDGYFEHIDVILYINNIDNPLNIRSGQILFYPGENQLDDFRYTDSGESIKNNDITKKLATYVNKTSRTDNNRQVFIENDYSLPPVVLPERKSPIKVDSKSIIIGGL